MSAAKRDDLQGLRGVAIWAVLLFHFYPQLFPNGYIGVDVFFVLSGFLISMILSKKDISKTIMLDFYYRRAKRILPLYLLLILFILLSVILLFPPERVESNKESAFNALILYTNIAATDPGKAYAAMLSEASDYFTHTWSLALEMQFYLIVPFIFMMMKIVGKKVTILLIGFLSLSYGLVIEDNVAFNSVFARLWQFLVGVCANQLSTHLETLGDYDRLTNIGESHAKDANCHVYLKVLGQPTTSSAKVATNITVYLLVLELIFQSLFPQVIPSTLLRCSSTILSGLIILLNSSCYLLSNKFIVYIGDISYALYLVHWPVYSYVKEYHDTASAAALGIVLSILLAILLSETFEKYYLRLKKTSVIALIVGLILSNAILISVIDNSSANSASLNEKLSSEGVQTKYINLTTEEVIKLNQLWFKNDETQLRYDKCHYRTPSKGLPIGWCDLPVSPPPSSPPHSLMLVGNSWAANILSTVHAGCKDKVSNLTLYWYPYCEVFVDTYEKKNDCKGKSEKFIESVSLQRPATLLILLRHIDFMKTKQTGNGSIYDDKVYKTARSRLAKIEPLVGKSIYILQSLPWPKLKIIEILNDHLKKGINTTNEELDAHVSFQLGRKRVAALVADCKKCKTLDYVPSLSDQRNVFRFFDNSSGLSHFTQTLHLTPIALQLVAPLFQNLCQNL